MPLPTFVVIGAPGAATSSLHDRLAAHPRIRMSAVREPHHFVFDRTCGGVNPHVSDRTARRRRDWVADRSAYERLWPDDGATHRGEVSPLYLYTAATPRLLRRSIPDVRVVVVLRDPMRLVVERWTAVHRSPRGMAAAVATEVAAPGEPYEPYDEWTTLVRLGRYARQLDRYDCYFSPDRLHVVLAEDLQRDPATADRVLAGVHGFLGVPRDLAAQRPARPALPEQRRGLRRRRRPDPVDLLDPATRRLLEAYYREDVDRLRVRLDRTLSGWCAARAVPAVR